MKYAEIYGDNAISDLMVGRSVRDFNKGCENFNDSQRCGRLLLVTNDLLHALTKVYEDRRITISSLSLHFAQISQSLLHEIVSDRLELRKLCACWVTKILF